MPINVRGWLIVKCLRQARWSRKWGPCRLGHSPNWTGTASLGPLPTLWSLSIFFCWPSTSESVAPGHWVRMDVNLVQMDYIWVGPRYS